MDRPDPTMPQLQLLDWTTRHRAQNLAALNAARNNVMPLTTSSTAATRVEPIGEIATRLSATFARTAAQHDADDSFITENYAALKASGLVQAGVPVELGGGGADVRALCDMLRILAQGCSATALAFAMHTHQVAIPAWRWQHTPARPMVEPLLRRVAAEQLILLTSGGSDWVGGAGTAQRVEGGYRITARKAFASGAPEANLFITGAVSEEEGGPVVVHFAAPMNAPQIRVLDTWHTLGMRGTGSHDVQIDGLFVPDDKVALKRKAGEWHPLFHIIATTAFPLIYAVYLGTAEGARDLALALAAKRPVTSRIARIAGEMDTALFAARAAHARMIDVVEQNAPGAESVNKVMMGRRLVERETLRAVELAMELAGGVGFYRDAGLERRFRDIQGARYHPMQREQQYEYAGSLALGQSVAHIY
jgi:indole-3-acetate monooxygenase